MKIDDETIAGLARELCRLMEVPANEYIHNVARELADMRSGRATFSSYVECTRQQAAEDWLRGVVVFVSEVEANASADEREWMVDGRRIYPPEFPKMPATSIVDTMSREDLWAYACLTGWRCHEEIWCRECGDGLHQPEDPGICGTCYATKYRSEAP